MMTNLMSGWDSLRHHARRWGAASQLVGAIFSGALALTIVMPPGAVPWPYTLGWAGLLAWLAFVTWRDATSLTVPNWAVYPVMGVGVVRGVIDADATFLLFWCGVWLAWLARVFGGGDAKLLMGLFGLFPNASMAVTLGATVLVTGIPQLLWKYRGRWVSGGQHAGWRILTRQWLPSGAELETHGRAGTWRYALAGVVYLLYFVRG